MPIVCIIFRSIRGHSEYERKHGFGAFRAREEQREEREAMRREDEEMQRIAEELRRNEAAESLRSLATTN